MTKERPGEREAFEVACKSSLGHDLSKTPDGIYANPITATAFAAWQARATLSARAGTEEPVACPECGGTRAEPGDVQVGTGTPSGEGGEDWRIETCADSFHAAPTRARQDAPDEVCKAEREADIAALIAALDNIGGSMRISDAREILKAELPAAIHRAAAIRALSPADGGGRG